MSTWERFWRNTEYQWETDQWQCGNTPSQTNHCQKYACMKHSSQLLQSAYPYHCFHCSSHVTIDQSHFSNRSCHHHYRFVSFILCLKVEKYCGVFETLGEKRLASHLLPGLEVLLPLLFPSITLEQVSSSHVTV